MKRVTKFYKRLWKEERGAALMLVGATLVVLMGMAAFGSDLAWFYLNASRIQRTADAAALGGVVWLPDNEAQAFSTAWNVADQNGYVEPDRGSPTMVNPARVTGELNQLRVRVTDTVPTFFLKVFGINEQTISREAVAQYIPPLKLGSPSHLFGNDPLCYANPATPDCAGNFWANIHATRTDTGMGDAFASYCAPGAGSDNGCTKNPTHRDTGYLYGVIPGGSSFTVQTLDMVFRNEQGGVANSDPHRTGDHNDFCTPAASCPGQQITVNIWAPDPTPLDVMDNHPSTLACTNTYLPVPQINPHDGPPFNPANWAGANGWQNTCSVSGIPAALQESVWVVQVVPNTSAADRRVTDLTVGNQANSGLNRYSIKSTAGNLFALGDFSLYNNAGGTTTAFYLAEVPDFYRGKTFVIELYDAAEFSGTGDAFLQPINPVTGNTFTSVSAEDCKIYRVHHNQFAATGWQGVTPTVVAPGQPCEFPVSPGTNNAWWIKFEIRIPETGYNCTDCWWKMNYKYPASAGASVNDTTTWRAYMLGNPIHLVR